MQVRKLFYEDSHLATFSARVTGCRETDRGFWIALDATAFYPGGGGQACDLGLLGDTQVLEVRETGEEIEHLCPTPLTVGKQVQGQIDWQRRFDLMQQHTGEHIVSGIANRLFGCHNVGFHMGEDVVTIDFDIPISLESLTEIEHLANQAVFDNLPVKSTVPEPAELKRLTYRSKRALSWPVRLVEIPGIDTCACCGIHTKFTGEIGIIKLLSCVKFHQGVRIEMICGKRALALLSEIYQQNKLVSQAFSAKLLETGAAAQQMNELLAKEKQLRSDLQRRLTDAIAETYKNAENAVVFSEELPAQPLAEKIARVCRGVAAVFAGSDKDGYRLCLISKTADVAPLGKALTQTFGGKGGGKPGFFQGNVPATRTAIEAFLENYFSE